MTFGLAAFLGALLLFLVQPLAGKHLLPAFGGSPAVWTTCQVFFQLALLGGYALAHGAERLGPRRQPFALFALLALGLGALAVGALLFGAPLLAPPTPGTGSSSTQIGAVLAVLLAGFALPYTVLATNGPTVQALYARARPEGSAYRLAALGNLGSLAGLLGYPLVVEPRLALPGQALLFTAGFALWAIALGLSIHEAKGAKPLRTDGGAEGGAGFGGPLFWGALSAVGSALLVVTTTQLCLDVASAPFLWVAPLALYLLTFVLAFELKRPLPRAGLALLSLVSIFAVIGALANPYAWSLGQQVAALLSSLFLGALWLHSELARAKPGTSRVTGFWLAVSAGGALGGAAAGLLPPLLLSRFVELQLTLPLVPALGALALALDPSAFPGRPAVRAIVAGGGGLLALGLGLALARVLLPSPDTIELRRGFFGTLRVADETRGDVQARVLYHGRIRHGVQLRGPAGPRTPTTYYCASSGLGVALRARREALGRPLRVGAVGLGAGTLAAWSTPGDRFRVYEIDEAVVALAAGPEARFDFVREARGTIEVVVGDARRLLQQELDAGQGGEFDVLVLDAFSGDAVPAHLVTQEAFALYERHLAPGGLIAAHVSNLHLTLDEVARGGLEAAGLSARLLEDDVPPENCDLSVWVLAARTGPELLAPVVAEVTKPFERGAGLVWTDRQSDLLGALKR